MTEETEKRIGALEKRVQRLAEFNQILMRHLLDYQGTSGLAADHVVPDLRIRAINVSDEVWEKFRYNNRL